MNKKSMNLFGIKDNFENSKLVPSIPIFEATLSTTPLITIAIPTYKREKLLKQALDSAINQASTLFYDIIIVDNDPERKCETELLVSQYRNQKVSYYKNSENLLMVGNWNRLFMLAKGEFVIMLHDDDLLYPDFLSNIHKVILKLNYNFDAIYTPWEVKDNDMSQKAPFRIERNSFYIEKLNVRDFLWGNIIGPPVGVCIRKSKFIEIGGFDNGFYPSLDYAFYVKFAHKFNCLKLIGKPLWAYRIEDNESLKTDTLINFVKCDTDIKHLILKEFGSSKNWFWNIYINVFVYKYLIMMTKLFQNNEINVKQVLKDLGYKYNYFHLTIYNIMNLFKVFYFKLRRKYLF